LYNTCAYMSCQLLLWLTFNFHNLCISVYTYTPYPAVAPAYPIDLADSFGNHGKNPTK